jgi:hypothetical protein
MPDISMCANVHCPSKEYCYRFTAIPGMRQSFSDFSCEDDEENCNYFYPNERCCKICGLKDGVHKMSCPTIK